MACRLCMTGEVIDARTALRLGLVTEVVAPDGLLPRALALATRIAGNPAETVRLLKQLFTDGAAGCVGIALEAEQRTALARTPDLTGVDPRRDTQTQPHRSRQLTS